MAINWGQPGPQNNALAYFQFGNQLGAQVRERQAAQQAAQQKDAEERVKAATAYIAQSAFQIVQLPPEQRAQAWDAYVDQGSQQFPGLAQYRGKYTPEGLNSIVAQAGKMPEFQQFQQPKYVPIGEAGLQGLQYGQPIGSQQQMPQPQPMQEGAPQQDGVFSFEAYKGAVNGLGKQGADAMLQRNGFVVSVRSPDEARMLPSGTRISLPDGTEGRVP